MNSPYSELKVKRHFGVKCRILVHCRRISEGRNQRVAGGNATCFSETSVDFQRYVHEDGATS
jgi:hypothetical protein